MVSPLIPLAISAGGSALSNLFGRDEETVSQVPLLTPQQQAAQNLLLQLGSTGQGAGIKLGDRNVGSLGDFGIQPIETNALANLSELMGAGRPSAFGQAENTLSALANNKFDPDDPSSGFGAFRRQASRATKDASDVLDRESAITGNRFGTAIGEQKRELAGRQSDALLSELSRLFESGQNRSLNAANSLVNLGGAENASQLNNLNAGFNFGGLERALNNAQAQAELEEFNRSRNERLESIGILQSVGGSNAQFGVPSVTASTSNPLTDLLNTITGQLASQYVGSIFDKANPVSNPVGTRVILGGQ